MYRKKKLSLPVKPVDKISFLGEGIQPSAVQSLFGVVRELAIDWPWDNIPPPDTPIYVDVPALGVEGAVLVQVSPRKDRAGISLFASPGHWKSWLRGDRLPPADRGSWSQLILVMDEKAPLTTKQRREVQEHRWSMPTMFDVPDWYAVQGKGVVRSVNRQELSILEAVASSICGLFHGKNLERWLRVWDGQDPNLVCRSRVPCHEGVFEVKLRSERVVRSAFSWNEIKTWDAGQHSHARLQELNQLLHEKFRYSPEGHGEGTGSRYVGDFLEIARREMMCSVVSLTPNQIEILLTDHLLATIEYPWDEELDFVIDTLSRFYAFLARKYKFDAQAHIERLRHRDLYRRVDAAWGLAA